MIALNKLERDRPLNVLCIGSHCDDIEIGCGGTLAAIADNWPKAIFTWLILSSDSIREKEARNAVQHLLGSNTNVSVRIEAFRNSYFPYNGAQIKEFVQNFRDTNDPDLIFTHRLEDRHQDHELTSRLTWNSFRDHQIVEYEIAKYEGDLCTPNVYVPLEVEQVERKIRVLLDSYKSQRDKRWFSRDAFLGLMRLRGIECNSATGYAEGFHVRKAVLDF